MPIRAFTPDDAEALAALHRSVGWPERSAAGWRWLARDPARVRLDAPLGWLAEDEAGRPVACLGNFIQTFRHGERTLHAATGHSIIVSPEGRGMAPQLIRTLMGQTGMVGFYTFNANARAAPLYKRHRLVPWPATTHDLKLAWPLKRWPRAVSRLLRELDHRKPALLAEVLKRIPEPLTPRPRPVRQADMPDGVALMPADLPGNWDAYWQALVDEGGLVADRSAEVMHHRLGDPDRVRPPVLLAVREGGALVGHAWAELAKPSVIDPPVLEIVDLVALERAPEAIDRLMTGLMVAARRLDAAKLRLHLVSPRSRVRLGPWAERARREGGWGHAHARFEAGAPDPGLWQPTPYDGDYGFCLRPAP
ncbi:GNAT family N-acetyltransferase [Brevundimonas poindexterae]|uniref:N-acetyltransferase n=1 Tax=Brevundimonas poindexterae TaxID=74325 RepID=UPI001CFDFC3F|nr:N-acetyltransferase [Brevundimonas poindexterae]